MSAPTAIPPAEPEITVSTPPKRKTLFKSRPWKKQFLFWNRRGHLYLGLFMIPWILVYAITGFLFNHRSVLPEHRRGLHGHSFTSFGEETLAGTGLDELPSAAVLAQRVTHAINGHAGPAEEAVERVELVEPEMAHFTWHSIIAAVEIDGKPRRLDIEVGGKGGDLFSPAHEMDVADFAAPKGIFADPSFTGQIESGVPKLVENLGLKAGDKPISLRRVPELVFNVSEGDRYWRVRYEPQTGAVNAEPIDAPQGLAWQRFLKILHFSVGYSGGTYSRWIWALFVDTVTICLVFWCLSGVIMWWQLRTVRWSGIAVLASSVVVASAIAWAMYVNLLG